MERKLASIQVIKDLQPIPNADAILAATVLGWNLVVKKTEFQVGDKCVFFEVDAIIPLMKGTEHLCKEGKPLRVRTIRLRGTLSQGVALPLTILTDGQYEVGQDVTEVLGVKKWEPYIPAELHGKVKGTRPSWIPKTDEPRLQSTPDALEEIKKMGQVVGTMKMDGSSITCFIKDNVFGITSRNMELIETPDNAYWKAAREAKVEEAMRKFLGDRDIAIQGELSGKGIQGNKMGMDNIEIYFYNLYDISAAKYLSTDELIKFTDETGLKMVPIVFRGVLPDNTNIASLLKMSNELKYSNGLPAEGIVWRPVVETESNSLKGRLSIKVISSVFLIKYNE